VLINSRGSCYKCACLLLSSPSS